MEQDKYKFFKQVYVKMCLDEGQPLNDVQLSMLENTINQFSIPKQTIDSIKSEPFDLEVVDKIAPRKSLASRLNSCLGTYTHDKGTSKATNKDALDFYYFLICDRHNLENFRNMGVTTLKLLKTYLQFKGIINPK